MGKSTGKFALAIALLFAATVCAASPASAQTRRFNFFGGIRTERAIFPTEPTLLCPGRKE